MNDENIKLEYIFDKTIDWLKFAEAKNGAILAINSAILFGVTRMALNSEIDSYVLLFYILSVAFLLSASILVSLLSFISRMEPPFWVSFPSKPEKVNLLFFGHICTLSPKRYLEYYYKLKDGTNNQHKELDAQLANQIVINSKIAFIKYRQFNIAVWITISALLTPLGAFLISKVKA